MRTQRTILSLLLAVSFAANAAADADSSAPPAPSGAAMTAPTELDWTFDYRGGRYGLQQFGPVAIHPRNAHVIWRNRAYRIPVTIPWVLAIAAVVVLVPFGFMAFGRKGKVIDARHQRMGKD